MLKIRKALVTKIMVTAGIAVAAALFFIFDLQRYFSLAFLKEKYGVIQGIYSKYPITTICIYMITYIVMAALSLPGAAVMTIAGGAIFGFWIGTLAASVASCTGATLAFLIARFLLKDEIQRRFPGKLAIINKGIEQDGALYLFSLRLVPVFPFFIINIVMGLTPIKTSTFYIVSQVGMLPGAAIYVNAGTRLASITSPGQILSLPVILSFAAIGIFPLAAKQVVNMVKKRKFS